MRRFLGNSLHILICLCFNAASMFAQAGGSLAGSVVDGGGAPITGALVTALRNTLPPASGRAISGANGTFVINAVPAGGYTLCVQVLGSAFLDPCEWSLSPVTANVTGGQSTAGVQLKLTAGAIVPIRLNDPQSFSIRRPPRGRLPVS
jgi:hypothetical protein